MLKLGNSLNNIKVMSLRSGGQVGTATAMIINPKNLRVEGWYVKDSVNGEMLVLVRSEIRELSTRGIVVNDHEVLTSPDELVRLKFVIEINFKLLGKQVVSQSGRKYGKVSDFAVETESMIIKKIYATQSIIRSFSGGNTSIDRTQIIEITKNRIIIEDPLEKSRDRVTAAAPVN